MCGLIYKEKTQRNMIWIGFWNATFLPEAHTKTFILYTRSSQLLSFSKAMGVDVFWITQEQKDIETCGFHR